LTVAEAKKIITGMERLPDAEVKQELFDQEA